MFMRIFDRLVQLLPRGAAILVLSVVPIFVLALHGKLFPSALQHSAFGDPDYGYLLNSLLLVEGKSPIHIDHPGTLVQGIGAAVIVVKSALDGSSQDLVGAVLRQPYEFLRATSDVLAMILCVSIFLLGIGLLRLGFSLPVVVVTQTAPLWLPDTWTYLVHVCPEILLASFCLAVAWFLLRQQAKENWSKQESAALGMLLGLGLSVKVTVAPLVAFFLWPKMGRCRWLGVVLVPISFLFFTFPIWSQYPRLLQWWVGIATHRENYGLGEAGILPSATTIRENIAMLWQMNSSFFYLLGIFPITAFAILSGAELDRKSMNRKLGLAVLVTAALFLLVVKQVAPRYLLPSIAVWAWLVPTTFERLLRHRLRILAFPLILAMLSLLFLSSVAGWERFQILTGTGNSSDKLSEEFLTKVAEFSECAKIYAPPLPVKEFALYGGDLATNATYTKRLQELYPTTIFYDIYPGQFRAFGQVLETREVQERIGKYKCAVVVGSSLILQKQQKFLLGSKTVLMDPVKLPFQLKVMHEKNNLGIFKIEKMVN